MLDKRNVIDEYKNKTNMDIMQDLDSRRLDFSVMCNNLCNDFNIGAVVRNANAFLAKEVIMYGRRKYDKRSTVGTHNYTHFHYCPDKIYLRDYLWQDNKVVIGVEDTPNAHDFREFGWDVGGHIVLMFGNEDNGIPDEDMHLCDAFVKIPQYGSVRSLNVACASSILMSHVAHYLNPNTRRLGHAY